MDGYADPLALTQLRPGATWRLRTREGTDAGGRLTDADTPLVLPEAGMIVNDALLALDAAGLPTMRYTDRLAEIDDSGVVEALLGDAQGEVTVLVDDDVAVFLDLAEQAANVLDQAIDPLGGPAGALGAGLAASPLVHTDSHGRLVLPAGHFLLLNLRAGVHMLAAMLRAALDHDLRVGIER